MDAVTDIGTGQAIAETIEMLRLGGPVVAILIVLSITALAIVIAKAVQFRALRLGDTRPVREALADYRAGRPARASAQLAGLRSPVAQVAASAIAARRAMRDDQGPVREAVTRQAAAHLENLRSHLRALEVIATLSPLLGLFGTVLGMIDAFQQMEAAGSRVEPSVLSGGIWEALLTTAVGLGVAIPATAASNWLDRRVERAAYEMEDAIAQAFTAEPVQPLGADDARPDLDAALQPAE